VVHKCESTIDIFSFIAVSFTSDTNSHQLSWF
jgi:hypothetical protein